MKKTERLLAIVLELQRSNVRRAEDLAETFETSVRTIYRDIQALCEAGVPIVGSPGIGYSLIEGYFLPPVSFTLDEAVTLLIGADFIEQRFDHHYIRNARSSRRKIEAILPGPIKEETERVRSGIRLLNTKERNVGREKLNIETIRSAILDGKKIHFGYHKRLTDADGSRETARTVAPYGLILVDGSWMLIAHCDLRQDLRHFRVSRIKDPVITDERFQLPSSFNLHDYRQTDDRNVKIRVLFDASIADKVQNTDNYYMEDGELHADGYYVNYRVRHPEELLHWILGWGAGVVVIEPESFKNRVREEIEKMTKRY